MKSANFDSFSGKLRMPRAKVYRQFRCSCCGIYFRRNLFQMPKKLELKRKWIEALGYSPTYKVKDSFKICVRHFKLSDLERPEKSSNRKKGRQDLKPNAVPSVNLRLNVSDVLAKNLNEHRLHQIHEEIEIKQDEDDSSNPLITADAQCVVKTESEIKKEPIDLCECYVVLEDFLKSRSALRSTGLLVNESFNIDSVLNETEIKAEVKTEPEL